MSFNLTISFPLLEPSLACFNPLKSGQCPSIYKYFTKYDDIELEVSIPLSRVNVLQLQTKSGANSFHIQLFQSP